MKFKLDFKRLFGKATDPFFAMGLTRPASFHGAIRGVLLGHSGGNITRAQALALEGIASHLHVVKKHSDRFLSRFNSRVSYDSIRVPVAGKEVLPVGTAGGLDSNAEGLEPFAYLFGFQVPGPVSLEPHEIEEMPFADDPRKDDLFVPPDFFSGGLERFLRNVQQYRAQGGQAVILPYVAALAGDDGNLENIFQDLVKILTALAPHVDGFVWSPLLAGARTIRCAGEFRRAAEFMASAAPGKLKLVEMAPYEESARTAWLHLAAGFLEGGGDGIVAVHGLEVARSEVPASTPWPYDTALVCGKTVAAFRQRAIQDARREFPDAFIAACGGFHDREEAFRACEYANVIMENEAFTRYGPGIAPVLLSKLVLRLGTLRKKGETASDSLMDYQRERWKAMAS